MGFLIKRLSLGFFLIALASLALLAWDWDQRPTDAGKWRVHLIQYVKVVDTEEAEQGVLDGLRESGLIEGQDYTITIHIAHGDMAMVSSLVDASLAAKADLLITLSTPTLQAALQR